MWTPLFILLDLLLVTIYSVTAIKTETMTTLCGGTINLSQEKSGTLRLKLTDDHLYTPYTDCYVKVSTDDHMQVVLNFLRLDINSFFYCPGDYLEVHDGLSEPTKEFFHFNDRGGLKICGHRLPKPFTTLNSNLTLRFVSDGEFQGAGFILLLTAFHEGECQGNEYQCSNSRCIHESLQCSDYNHCGDGKDSCPMSPLLIAGYSITAIIFIIACIFLVIVLRYRFSKHVHDGVYDYYVDDILPPRHPPPIEDGVLNLFTPIPSNFYLGFTNPMASSRRGSEPSSISTTPSASSITTLTRNSSIGSISVINMPRVQERQQPVEAPS